MVGIGAQGSIEDADAFVAATGIQSVTMLWDQSFALWSHFDVLSQPTVLLVDPAGNVIHEFDGVFNAQDVLDRL